MCFYKMSDVNLQYLTLAYPLRLLLIDLHEQIAVFMRLKQYFYHCATIHSTSQHIVLAQAGLHNALLK